MDTRCMEIGQEWGAVCEQLQHQLGDCFAIRWLKKIVPDKMENNQVSLLVPSPCIQELVQQNYANQILSLWQSLNPAVDGLDFRVSRDVGSCSTVCTPAVSMVPAAAQLREEGAEPEILSSVIDPTHTFDTFVVGKSNEFAYAAARRIAEDPTVSFNPLYIHGAPGLGKTHLMHAITIKMRELYPKKNILFLSSEQFVHQFVNALRNRNTESLQDIFRSADVLLVDDIQFICGKKASQEEFFHTFNFLIGLGKKIILSSDSLPLELQGLEERLKTRLAHGLVVGINSTSYELRLGILQEKLKLWNITVPDEVLEFLARRITSNIRELEGALKRVVAHAELIGSEISLANTAQLLKDMLGIAETQVSILQIQRATAQYFSVQLSDLKSARRERRIARPRQIAMYLSKSLTTQSLPEIAQQFERDHSTVLHAIKTVEDLMRKDAQVAQDIKVLEKGVKGGEHV